MDHDRYAWSPLPARAPVSWPGGKRVALIVMPTLQWFPLEMASTPFAPVGTPDEPYPDYRAYSHRDYGNRVGIFRIMAILDRLRLPATCRVNGIVAKRYPDLLAEVVRRRWKVAAYGRHMGRTHNAGLRPEDEAGLIEQTLGLPPASYRPAGHGVALSGGTESPATLDLLLPAWPTCSTGPTTSCRPRSARRRASFTRCPRPLIWTIRSASGRTATRPTSSPRPSWTLTGCSTAEANDGGGRVLPIAIHPWIVGQPHRIRTLDRVLTDLADRAGVWPATAAEVLAAFTSQQEHTA